MAKEISQHSEYQQANRPNVQSQLYNTYAHQSLYPPRLSNGLLGHPDHASIANAVHILKSAGVLPTLLRPSCLEACHVLLTAIQNGLSFTEPSILATSEVLPPFRPASSMSDNVHRESSIRSHRSWMSGDTLLNPTNDAEGAWRHSLQQPIPETSEEAMLFNTSHSWHEAESKQFHLRNFSYPVSSTSQLQTKLQPAFDDTTMTDQQDSEIPFTQMLQNEIPHSSNFPWDDPELPVQASQAEFANLAGTHDPQDKQWPPAAEEEDEPSEFNSPLAPSISVVNTPRAPRSHQTPQFVLVDCKPKEEEKPGNRSPCPLCESSFIAQREMISHTKAKHDQPTQFLCTHMATTKQGLERCPFTACVSNRFRKHHTETHRECPLLPQCVLEVHVPRPKRVWGCWFCTWVTISLEDWVRHHMQDHKGYSRKLMSHTSYIRSLLSQNAIQESWQAEVRQLEKETKAKWSITWFAGEDLTRDEIIHDLETGFWGDHDFHRNQEAARGLAAAALKATAPTRTKLGSLRGCEQNNIQHPSTSGGSALRPRRQRSLRHLPLLRSRSIVRSTTTDAIRTSEDMPQVPSGAGDGHAQHSSTAFGAAIGDEVHLY